MASSSREQSYTANEESDFVNFSSPYKITQMLEEYRKDQKRDDTILEWTWRPDNGEEMSNQEEYPETTDMDWVWNNIFLSLEDSRRNYFSRERRVKTDSVEGMGFYGTEQVHLTFQIRYDEIPSDNRNNLRFHLSDEKRRAISPEKVGLDENYSTIDIMKDSGELELCFILTS